MIRDMRNVFEDEENNYYKPVIISDFQSNNYIEYKSTGDRITISVIINKHLEN